MLVCIYALISYLHGLHVIRWAAYVAGAILVLMTELGVRFEDGLSILVRVSYTYSNLCRFVHYCLNKFLLLLNQDSLPIVFSIFCFLFLR